MPVEDGLRLGLSREQPAVGAYRWFRSENVVDLEAVRHLKQEGRLWRVSRSRQDRRRERRRQERRLRRQRAQPLSWPTGVELFATLAARRRSDETACPLKNWLPLVIRAQADLKLSWEDQRSALPLHGGSHDHWRHGHLARPPTRITRRLRKASEACYPGPSLCPPD